MTRPHVPAQVLDAAHARARAREGRDWGEADRLRAVIEEAGWRVVDRGIDFALSPAAPPDIVEDGRIRYGSSASVPSRLDAAPVGMVSVVTVATDRPEELERAMSALREHGPDGSQVVVVANAPSLEQAAALAALDAVDPGGPGIGYEVVWTSERLGHAAALNAGIRRAAAASVILLDQSVAPLADVVTPIVGALEDDSVAVVGPWGLRARDLRHFEPATGDCDAIDGACLVFRRADYARRGPLDERFVDPAFLDIWWSLVLRDEGEGVRPRRALAIAGLPVARHGAGEGLIGTERSRLTKRNFYRLLDRFRDRGDLLAGEDPGG